MNNEETQEEDRIEAAKRQCATCYCKYNVDHAFKTFKEREYHEQNECPDRESFERKYKHSQYVYAQHKDELKKGAGKRKTQMDELFGHNNGPMASQMPTLHYKYRMNEPFVNGERGCYHLSHEQNDFKKKFVYGIGEEADAANQVKTAQDEMDDMKTEFNEQLLKTFEGKNAPDVHTLVVKQDQEDMFGLRITSRNCPQVNRLFDFDIEEYISLK